MVDFVFDFAAGFIPNDCVLTLAGAEIAAVTVNDLVLTGQQ